MSVRIVLDTGVFYRPDALESLASLPHDVAVPAVAFTERARQLAKRGIGPDEFADRLAANEFSIEPYGREQAQRLAPAIHDGGAWRRLARDAMIAGHVRLSQGDVLWTTNPEDFLEVGLDEKHVMSVSRER